MISMFAFILALGIVVDDAIVAGENIYEYRQRGMSHLDAAILGARDMAVRFRFPFLRISSRLCRCCSFREPLEKSGA